MTSYVLTDITDGVLTLTFNRPERRNSLSPIVCQALGEAIDAADEDDDVRCILITSTGTVFCSGGDLEESNVPFKGWDTSHQDNNPLLNALARSLKPIVAAVQGHAVGGGVTMLLHCDQVFIADNARLTLPFTKLGVVPEIASSMLLPRLIGHVRAFSMFVLGEPMDGVTAAAVGLANEALPADAVEPRARAVASAIAELPPNAIRLTKSLMRDRDRIVEHMRRENDLLAETLKTDEAKEAVDAFVEKRKPDFQKFRLSSSPVPR